LLSNLVGGLRFTQRFCGSSGWELTMANMIYLYCWL